MIKINNANFEDLKFKDIQEFLNNPDSGESFFIEFKNDSTRKESLAKEISAFANSYGGYLFLGVEDDKTITGCTKWDEEKINNVIYGNINPLPQFDIRKIKIPKQNSSLYVIKVEECIETPYITNDGKMYIRSSSSSIPITDASTLNNLIERKKDFEMKLQNKLSISDINSIFPINNFCGYLDFGFGLITKNLKKTFYKFDNTDFEKVSKHLAEYDRNYSLSKIGNTISVTIGHITMSQFNQQVLTMGSFSNTCEIMRDGSFKCRVLITAEENSSFGNILSIYYIPSIFRDIYEMIFGDDFKDNFIEAFKYEKLTVVRQFQPKVIISKENCEIDYDKKFSDHLLKYGNNIVCNTNRIPANGFFKIDKNEFQERNIDYNSKTLYEFLFYSHYQDLGYIDKNMEK